MTSDRIGFASDAPYQVVLFDLGPLRAKLRQISPQCGQCGP